ncbi:MAG: VWA domain-containing protein [Burkholderiales bacterium]|nr:VWA domain-containing protein [Burkholderiales bacterium]
MLACAALAIAVIDPHVEREQPVLDLIVAIDITQSMNTRDYRMNGQAASRLAYAKQALAGLLRELPCGTRIGWAIFNEYRSFLLFTPVEACANYRELAATLANIDGRMAWAGASEIAKGLYSGLLLARELQGRPDLVFMTDGHEAPPINPRYRPEFTGTPGEVHGMIFGLGGDTLLPIPKFDADGNSLGVWEADEVLQTDRRSMGRGGSVEGEAMVESGGGPLPSWMPPAGREHWSSLREEYLQVLASETGLGYQRLTADSGLKQSLAPLLRPAVIETGLRREFGLAALLLLVAGQIRWPAQNGVPSKRFSRWLFGT